MKVEIASSAVCSRLLSTKGYPAFVSKVRSGGLAHAYVAELTRGAVRFNGEAEKQELTTFQR